MLPIADAGQRVCLASPVSGLVMAVVQEDERCAFLLHESSSGSTNFFLVRRWRSPKKSTFVSTYGVTTKFLPAPKNLNPAFRRTHSFTFSPPPHPPPSPPSLHLFTNSNNASPTERSRPPRHGHPPSRYFQRTRSSSIQIHCS